METALLFDTLKTSKHLQAAGFEQEQAEALTEEFKSVVESNFAKLSTTDQVANLEINLNEKLEQKATKEQSVHLQEQLEQKATEEQVASLETNLNEKIDSKFKLLSWMVGFGVSLNLMTLGGMLAFLFSFLPASK